MSDRTTLIDEEKTDEKAKESHEVFPKKISGIQGKRETIKQERSKEKINTETTENEKKPDINFPKKESKVNLSDIDKAISDFKKTATIDPPVFDTNKPPEVKFPTKKRGPKPKTTTALSGDILTGMMFIFIIDNIIPAVICFGNNSFSKKKVNPMQLQLTEKQKRELEPLAEQVAQKLQVSGDPVLIFFLAMFGIYGVNLMMLRNAQ